jgi:O-6-methylguanine DNA methyltransferase
MLKEPAMSIKLESSEMRTGEIHFAFRACSLGGALVAQSSKGICAILLGKESSVLQADLRRRFSKWNLVERNPELLEPTLQALDSPGRAQSIPVDLIGTPFQLRVWRALLEIPAGATRTYCEVACQLDMPKGARAVGTACGVNPVAVFVPCHRVIRSDGSLAGYRWGIEIKRTLLERENRNQRASF